MIHSNLYSYLHERYAHEIEFQTLKAIQRNEVLLFATPGKWIQLKLHSDGMVVRTEIARWIRKVYGLNDNRLVFLDRLRVHSILINGLDRSYWELKP